jgi:cyclopropane fatty-acyl-phospholipid synthase-like methyltransferase
MDKVTAIQEDQYEIPYHYIPSWDRGVFTQTRHWGWGFRYLGGLIVALDLLQEHRFRTLLDVGCGDGRFLREAQKKHPDAEILGVDYSERAIQLAAALNPHISFVSINILDEPLNRSFDIATLIEVIEHIHPDQLELFMSRIAASLNDRGRIVLTVPHVNKPLLDKHYQHFDIELLLTCLRKYFRPGRIIPFDSNPLGLRLTARLIGVRANNYVITSKKVNRWFFKRYLTRYLYCKGEASCLRLACVATKR